MSKLTLQQAETQFGPLGKKIFAIDVSEVEGKEDWVIVRRPTGAIFEVAKSKTDSGQKDVDDFIARSCIVSHDDPDIDKLFEANPTLKYRLSSGAYDLLESNFKFAKKAPG